MSLDMQHITVHPETAKQLLSDREAWVTIDATSSLCLEVHGKVLVRHNWADALVQASIVTDSGASTVKGFYRLGGIVEEGMLAVWVAGGYGETYHPTSSPAEYVSKLHFEHVERLWAFRNAPHGRK